MMNSDWIRTMRTRQGLKGFELAQRLRVSAARVSMLEKDETKGAVTLKMMERVASALDCRFEYRLVPLTDNVESTRQGEKPRYRVIVDIDQSKNKTDD